MQKTSRNDELPVLAKVEGSTGMQLVLSKKRRLEYQIFF